VVALAKNPTGFNEIIKTYLTGEPKAILILINDQIADGRDVSWLWDVNFEDLEKNNHKFIVSGIRGADMALRLKYAKINSYQVIDSPETALETSLNSIPQNDTLLVIPTYTAMLELKKLFVKKGIGGEFWED
jgi:UDP-N-acetylmuramyl tripeptide synthase